MVDDYKETNVFFSKQDILGKELKGAKLQIKDKETGKVVKEWTSGETPSTFGLKPGKYEFVETAAPKGYKIATSIEFEITKDGQIKADTNSLKTVGSSNILVMVDKYEEKPGDKPSEEPNTPGDKPSEEPNTPGDKPSEEPNTPNGKTSENQSNNTNKKSNLPKTGEGINKSFYVTLLGVVGTVTLLVGIKKRKNILNEEEK